MKRWALFAVVAATAMITGLLGMAPVGAAGSGDIIPWALQAENPSANATHESVAQATTDAKNFNVIIAHPIAYSCPTGAPAGCTSDVAAMKAANPKLKILMYMNSTFGQNDLSGPGPATDFQQCLGQANAFPASWYEYSSATQTPANAVINPQSGNCLMNPSNPLWIANRVAMCTSEAKTAGYSGCYLDDLGLGPFRSKYLNHAPFNPATNALWQQPAWLTATANLAKGVTSKAGTLVVYGNGLTDGPNYYNSKAPTSQIMSGVAGGIAEGWLRQATAPATAYPTATAWKQNVTMIGAVEALNKPLLTLTKCWTCTTSTLQGAWLQFSLASFLMGTNGKSMFFYSPSQSVSRTSAFALYNTSLGTPSGAMTASGAAFTRKFASGIVVVNPGTASVVVSLGGTYHTVPGGCANAATKTTETSLTMAKDTACILTTT